MTNVSGWCSPAPGMRHTEYEHVSCMSRLCCCEDFGGHVRNAQGPAVERDSASYMGAIRGETCDNRPINQDGPEGSVRQHRPESSGPRPALVRSAEL